MQLKVKNRIYIIKQVGTAPIEVKDELNENENIYLHFKVGQFVESLANMTKKTVSIQVIEEAIIDPSLE